MRAWRVSIVLHVSQQRHCLQCLAETLHSSQTNHNNFVSSKYAITILVLMAVFQTVVTSKENIKILPLTQNRSFWRHSSQPISWLSS